MFISEFDIFENVHLCLYNEHSWNRCIDKVAKVMKPIGVKYIVTSISSILFIHIWKSEQKI